MNQKLIMDLADQADEYAFQQTNTPGEYHPDWHTIRNVRFAELVITDVVDILASYRVKVLFHDGIEHNCQHPIHAIQKHFGIEP